MIKKAELLSIWWIFVIAMIVAGIVIGVSIYYSVDINMNDYHAKILRERIARCLIKNGNLNYDLSDFSFFSECNIKKKIFDNGNFFVKISVYDDEKILEKKYGNLAYESECEIIEKVPSKTTLRCFKKREIASYDGKDVVVEITSGVGQEGERISAADGK